jgi:predicted O-linked N-acetylglucosamine transferase (SPINDLY family)
MKLAERASIFGPKLGLIWANMAMMCVDAEQLDRAMEYGRRGVEVDPDSQEAKLALATVSPVCGLASEAIEQFEQILTKHPLSPVSFNECFVRTLTMCGAEEMQRVRRRWYASHRYQGARRPHDNEKTTGRRLRVGYVSGDFKRHSASMLFGQVVTNHDPERFDVYLYSTMVTDEMADPITGRFKAAAGAHLGAGLSRWREIIAPGMGPSTVDDDAAEKIIRDDKIDVLVDLSAHTAGSRLPLFTRKLAPVQVTAWGFAHGTGCPEIDWFFADPVALPKDERKHYAEKIWDLPCVVPFWAALFDEYKLEGVSKAPVRKDDDDTFTFGVSCRFEKISPQALAAWRRILERVPNSRILFKDMAFERPYSIRHVREAFAGVKDADQRLVFSIGSHHPQHLLGYQKVDLFLDPFPHSGGVVGLEQLYMGVPVLTYYGPNMAGRTTSAVLTAMGREEWIARTVDAYVDKATELAEDPKSLFEARKTLRRELLESPVCQPAYVRAVEAAYEAMWAEYCGVKSAKPMDQGA